MGAKLQVWLFTVLCMIAAAQSQNGEDCPNPVECDEDPCLNARCPRFLNAQCRPDNCSGSCVARFFHFKGHEITERCDIETCDEKECPPRRMCVEEAFPASCPDQEQQCRQYIRARCELPPPPQPPSDCALVLCRENTICVVEETRIGPVARCRPPPFPTSCDEVQCDEGMECRQRDREGRPPVVRCVPRKFSPFPRDCSAVLCSPGTICMIFGRRDKPRARCVRPPRVTCEDLDCEESSMVCRESRDGARCETPQNCDELLCPEGLMCQNLFIFASGTPLCIPPEFARDCSELTCGNRQSACVSWEFARRSVNIAFCYPNQELPVITPRVPSCADLTGFCEGPPGQICADLLQSDRNANAVSCNQIDCGPGPPCREDEERCYEIPRNLAMLTSVRHACIREQAAIEFNTNCSTGRRESCSDGTTCTDVSYGGNIVGTVCDIPYFVFPSTCEEAACEGDEEECLLLGVEAPGSVAALCVPSVFLDEALRSLAPFLPEDL